MNIFLSNTVILILTVIAFILTIFARFTKHRYVSGGCSILGFLLVIACIIYALLLGANLADVLLYVLVFSLVGAIAFLPNDTKNSESESGAENDSEADRSNERNEVKSDVNNEEEVNIK